MKKPEMDDVRDAFDLGLVADLWITVAWIVLLFAGAGAGRLLGAW